LLPIFLRQFADIADHRQKSVSKMAQGTKAVKSRAVICLFDLVQQATNGSLHSTAESLVESFDIGAEAAGIKEEKKPYYSADRLLQFNRRYAKEHPEDYSWTISNFASVSRNRGFHPHGCSLRKSTPGLIIQLF
jgi:hypothetical protein